MVKCSLGNIGFGNNFVDSRSIVSVTVEQFIGYGDDMVLDIGFLHIQR